MSAYIIRRLLYAVPILIGVNLITFVLFFVVNSPDDMARMQLGMKRVTPEAIQTWKRERGYDRPLLYNARADGLSRLSDTIFFDKSVRLFAFDFGASDSGRDIGYDISQRMWPSLAIAVPSWWDCWSTSASPCSSSSSVRPTSTSGALFCWWP
jgi:peptide/nickel transport system permease protein